MVHSNSPSKRSPSKAFEEDYRRMWWQQVSRRREGGALGRFLTLKSQKTNLLHVQGWEVKSWLVKPGQNEAKALLQRCLFRPPGEEKCLK